MTEFQYDSSGYVIIPEHIDKGQDTARWVLAAVTRFPVLHNQDDWGTPYDSPLWQSSPDRCGTTHCVGGWAMAAHRDNGRRQIDRYNNMWAPVDVGADLLGIDTADAAMLFYNTTNEQAVRALEFLSRGEPIDWDSVGVESWEEAYADYAVELEMYEA